MYLVVLAAFLGSVLVSSASGQAVYTAKRASTIQAGGALLFLRTDYQGSVQGYSGWADYNINRLVGFEVIGNSGSVRTPRDIAQKSIFVGPKITYHRNKIAVFGTISFGTAQIKSQRLPDSAYPYGTFTHGNYFAYAFGGGVEYHLNRKVNLRPFAIQTEKWPDFEPHTLSPMSFTFGASYVIR
jgi:hypothetical protein